MSQHFAQNSSFKDISISFDEGADFLGAETMLYIQRHSSSMAEFPRPPLAN